MKTQAPKLMRQQKAEILGEVIKFIPGDTVGIRVWGTFPDGREEGRRSKWVVEGAISNRALLRFKNSVPERGSEPACKIVICHLPRR